MKEVKRLKNGNIISQGAGKFDNYCVFIDGYAPRDEEYFNFFIEKSKIHGKDKYIVTLNTYTVKLEKTLIKKF